MKLFPKNKYFYCGLTAFLVIVASMLFYYGFFHMSSLIDRITGLLGTITPILYGLAIAFLINPVERFIEESLLMPLSKKANLKEENKINRVIRWVSVICSLLFLFLTFYALLMMMLPQLIKSIINLINSFPDYVNAVEKWMSSLVKKGWAKDDKMIVILNQYSSQAQNYLSRNILPQMQGMIRNFSNGIFEVVIFFKNFFIGAIVSVYVLADKEKFIAKSKMIVYALFPTNWANNIIHATRFTNDTFSGFISGKILDSVIIGVLCYIGTTILNMPYAMLISVIVGVTNLIPFFGPYLGAVPSAFLILLVDPLKCLYFILFILVLQQFDGNILGPKILGSSTGLSSFMVIVSIMIGGGLFGIPGMIIGVPSVAVLYAGIWTFIRYSLRKKNFSSVEKTYENIDCIDTDTKEILPLERKKKVHVVTRKTHKNPIITRLLGKVLLGIRKLESKIVSWIESRKK